MDIDKAPNDQKLYLCKWYFKVLLTQLIPGTYWIWKTINNQENKKTIRNELTHFNCFSKNYPIFIIDLISDDTDFCVGFLFLPFVWAVNAVWFFNEAFIKPTYDEQKLIRKYVIMSAIGTLLWAAAIASWVTVFQLNRAHWGEAGDAISFVIPLGRA